MRDEVMRCCLTVPRKLSGSNMQLQNVTASPQKRLANKALVAMLWLPVCQRPCERAHIMHLQANHLVRSTSQPTQARQQAARNLPICTWLLAQCSYKCVNGPAGFRQCGALVSKASVAKCDSAAD